MSRRSKAASFLDALDLLIAKAADVCLKPWSHAVVPIDPSAPADVDDL